MRKFYGFLLAAAALVASVTPAAAQGAPKWGYIHLQKILAEAPGADEARQKVEQEIRGFQSELQKLETEIDRMISDYERQQNMLAAQERQQREAAIMQKQQELQQQAMQYELQVQQRQQELLSPIMDRVQTALNEIRQQGGYSIIFDAASGAIVTADPALDLTEQVLARLRAMASN